LATGHADVGINPKPASACVNTMSPFFIDLRIKN